MWKPGRRGGKWPMHKRAKLFETLLLNKAESIPVQIFFWKTIHLHATLWEARQQLFYTIPEGNSNSQSGTKTYLESNPPSSGRDWEKEAPKRERTRMTQAPLVWELEPGHLFPGQCLHSQSAVSMCNNIHDEKYSAARIKTEIYKTSWRERKHPSLPPFKLCLCHFILFFPFCLSFPHIRTLPNTTSSGIKSGLSHERVAGLWSEKENTRWPCWRRSFLHLKQREFGCKASSQMVATCLGSGRQSCLGAIAGRCGHRSSQVYAHMHSFINIKHFQEESNFTQAVICISNYKRQDAGMELGGGEKTPISKAILFLSNQTLKSIWSSSKLMRHSARCWCPMEADKIRTSIKNANTCLEVWTSIEE